MAPHSRRRMVWLAIAAATAAARRVSATSRRRASSLTIKDVEAAVDRRIKCMAPQSGSRWFDVRSAMRSSITICTSGVVTALMYAYIEKSNEATKKDIMLFIYQREATKERAKEDTTEPAQPRKFLGFFRY